MKFIALFLSGGVGSRIGGEVPKQYLSVSGRPVFSYSLEILLKNEDIEGAFVVADGEWEGEITSAVSAMDVDKNKLLGFSLPGASRQLSILNGLRDIASKGYDPDQTYVVIHDAARPLLTESLLSELIKSCGGHDGALPVLPMKDTIYTSSDKKTVTGLLDRDSLFAGQSPEAYKLGRYLMACEALLPKEILGVRGACEPAVLAGMDIVMIPGDEGNFKITTPGDLERFEKTS